MNKFPWRLRCAWWLIDRVAPWMRSSQESYFERLESLIQPQIRLLDIGCGKEFLMGWLPPDKYCRWSASILDRAVIFGIDPFFPSLQENPSHLNACAFADRLPFPAATFDFVTANMVLEHIAEPDSLQEVFRVLKPDGFFLLHTPNLRAPQVAISNLLPYSFKRIIVPILEGRQEDDVFQTHYRLNTKETIESVARRLGFQIEWIHYVFNAPLTQVLGPAVIIELLLTRVLTKEHFASWRPDLIGLLRKPAAP